MDYYSKRLVREIQLLQRCEVKFGLRAKPVIDQLVADSNRLLPDKIPPSPLWVMFEWPRSGEVDLRSYWKVAEYHSAWKGEYL